MKETDDGTEGIDGNEGFKNSGDRRGRKKRNTAESRRNSQGIFGLEADFDKDESLLHSAPDFVFEGSKAGSALDPYVVNSCSEIGFDFVRV